MKKFTQIQNINEDFNFLNVKQELEHLKAILLCKRNGISEFGVVTGNEYMKDDAYEVTFSDEKKEIIKTDNIIFIKWIK
jgi:hypothetical protein